MKRMKYVKIIFIVFTLFPFHLSAETAEEKGLRIAKASYENGRGFTDMVSDQLMILIDPKGNELVSMHRAVLRDEVKTFEGGNF